MALFQPSPFSQPRRILQPVEQTVNMTDLYMLFLPPGLPFLSNSLPEELLLIL